MANVNGFSVFDFLGTFSESTTASHAFLGEGSTLATAPVPLRAVDVSTAFEVREPDLGPVVHERALSVETAELLERGLADAAFGLAQPVPADALLDADDAE